MPNEETAPRSPARRRSTRRFSKAEAVFVLALLLIVVSVVMPTTMYLRHRYSLDVAMSDINDLREACDRFFEEYGVWPTAYPGEAGDVWYGRLLPNYEVMNALRAIDGQGNDGHSVNPRRLVLIELRKAEGGSSGLTEEGNFLDPWGMPYQIVLDSDYNNVCEVAGSIYAKVKDRGMIAWSFGPDRRPDTKDDILSWTWGSPE